jgi:hypothetical protein
VPDVRHHLEVRLNGTLVSEYHDARRNGREGYIGLENAGNNLMYAQLRIRELTTDTTAPTITIRNVPDGLVILQGTPFTADYDCADEQDLVECSATPIQTTPGRYTFRVTAKDAAGNETVVERTYSVVAWAETSAGGTVPATLALTLGTPATFGAFTPGVARDYTASTRATVISTAGDAALSVADPSSTHTGHLVNGAFFLPQRLQANANGGAYAPVGGTAAPTVVHTYNGPVANDEVTLGFKQSIGASDALRTGTYSKTLTYTLSTTTP